MEHRAGVDWSCKFKKVQEGTDTYRRFLEMVKKLAEDNATHRQWVIETHTLGPKPVLLLVENLKKSDPNHAHPSDGKIYSETRKRRPGRTNKTNPEVVQISKITEIQKMISLGNVAEANAITISDKPHAKNWLVGRKGKSSVSTIPPYAPTEQYVQDLTTKLRHDLERELEFKVKKKVTYVLKKLGEAIPGLNLDIGEFCATISSDQDDNGTPMTEDGTST
ncbi:hypothetical protein OROMI_020697 [Orobanche minor]